MTTMQGERDVVVGWEFIMFHSLTHLESVFKNTLNKAVRNALTNRSRTEPLKRGQWLRLRC